MSSHVTEAFGRVVAAFGVQWPERVLRPIVETVTTLWPSVSDEPLHPNQIKFKNMTIESCHRDPETYANGHSGETDKEYKKMKKEAGKYRLDSKSWEVEVFVNNALSFRFKVFYEKNSDNLCFRSQVVHRNHFIGGTSTEGQWSKMDAAGMYRYLDKLGYVKK